MVVLSHSRASTPVHRPTSPQSYSMTASLSKNHASSGVTNSEARITTVGSNEISSSWSGSNILRDGRKWVISKHTDSRTMFSIGQKSNERSWATLQKTLVRPTLHCFLGTKNGCIDHLIRDLLEEHGLAAPPLECLGSGDIPTTRQSLCLNNWCNFDFAYDFRPNL